MLTQVETTDENPPVSDTLEALRSDVAELKAMLEPIGPFLEMLPELAEKIGPAIDGIKDSPVLKMIGLKL